MTLRYHTSGNARPWSFATRPMDPCLRLMKHGPVQPMQQPGLIARLFGRSA